MSSESLRYGAQSLAAEQITEARAFFEACNLPGECSTLELVCCMSPQRQMRLLRMSKGYLLRVARPIDV